MRKTLIMGMALMLLATIVIAGQFSEPFKGLFGTRAQAEICMGADTDGIADASNNYQCLTEDQLPKKAKDRIEGSINYYLVQPDGFMTANGAGGRALKITGLNPEKFYQIKLDSADTFEKTAFSTACPFPNQGVAWQCGTWNDGTRDIGFIVLETLKPNSNGVLMYNMPRPLALQQGVYDNVSLVITENEAPWKNVALSDLDFIVTG